MKTPRQFFPLLSHALGFTRYGPWPLLLWYCLTVPLLFYATRVLNPTNSFLETASLDIVFPLTLVVNVWFIFVVSGLLFLWMYGGSYPMVCEFLLTRAVDRKIFLRCGLVAGLILIAGPMIVNLALSPLKPDLTAWPSFGVDRMEHAKRYLAAFPSSYWEPSPDNGPLSQLIVRNGNVAFAGWLIWAELVLNHLTAFYLTLATKPYQRWVERVGVSQIRERFRYQLVPMLLVGAPMLLLWALVLGCAHARINVYEESFLFFSSHLVTSVAGVMILVLLFQAFVERRFATREFP